MQEQVYKVTEEGYGLGYTQPKNCPSCGLVPSDTGYCGYCGERCE